MYDKKCKSGKAAIDHLMYDKLINKLNQLLQ